MPTGMETYDTNIKLMKVLKLNRLNIPRSVQEQRSLKLLIILTNGNGLISSSS